MSWDRNLTNLRDVLADLFFDYNDSVAIVRAAGLKPAHMRFDRDKAVNNWTFILDFARKQEKEDAILEEALKQYPEDPFLQQAKANGIDAVRGADIEKDVSWQDTETEGEQLEKILGKQNTLLPISFLQAGFEKARSVVRIVRGDGGLGSGFLTGDNLIVTNHHVLDSLDTATAAKAQFNYQKSSEGLDLPFIEKELAPDQGFATDEQHDWTAVRLTEVVGEEWPGLQLTPQTPQKDSRAIIIQHPGGDSKQIGLYHNMISYASAETGRVQYWTDTLPGSSGSPVFDHDWNVIALHHSGGRLKEPGTKLRVYRNEGIHINTVIGGIEAAKQAGKL